MPLHIGIEHHALEEAYKLEVAMTSDKKRERMREIIFQNTYIDTSGFSGENEVAGITKTVDAIFTAFPSLSREPLEEEAVYNRLLKAIFLYKDYAGLKFSKEIDEVGLAKNLTDDIFSHFSAPGRVAVNERLVGALEAIFKCIDDGLLVRNTENDSQSNWAIKQIPLVNALSKAKQALLEARGGEEK